MSVRPTRIRSLAVPVAVAALGALVVSACSSSSGATPASNAAAVSTPAASAPPPSVTVTPAAHATSVAPDVPVVVKAAGAPLASVLVRSRSGAVLTGAYDKTHMTWTSTGSMVPQANYDVTAVTSAGSGGPAATARSTFTTLTPAVPFTVSWEPVDGQTVGVGEPITLQFSQPVKSRADVQRRLSVRASPAAVGAWHWYSDTVVHWRPKTYWKAGTAVTVQADLAGLDNGDGQWGVRNRTMTFKIGTATISYANAATHTLTVTQNGRTVRTVPASMGRDAYRSMDGPHNVLEVAPSVTMDSATVGIPKGNPDYYYETVLWDVKFTSGGEYVHSAPWSVADQGSVNVSHGCVNLAPAEAKWFYSISQVGDIVDVQNTGRAADTSQEGTDWSIPWAQWVAGDALPYG